MMEVLLRIYWINRSAILDKIISDYKKELEQIP